MLAEHTKMIELEDRLPWSTVKKSWRTRRLDWVAKVRRTFAFPALGRLLLQLEGAIKIEALSPAWSLCREGWRGRAEGTHTGEKLVAAVEELERAVQWDRFLAEARGAGSDPTYSAANAVPSTGLPPPIGDPGDPDGEGTSAATAPPQGVPRVAARMLLLLRALGVREYEPGVVVQLLSDDVSTWIPWAMDGWMVPGQALAPPPAIA